MSTSNWSNDDSEWVDIKKEDVNNNDIAKLKQSNDSNDDNLKDNANENKTEEKSNCLNHRQFLPD